MAERTQGWTPEQKRQIAQNRQERARQSKYGYGPGPMGPAEQARAALLLRQGPFVPTSWLRQFRNGQWYVRPTDRQTGRIEAGNWQPGEWRLASEVLGQNRYDAWMRGLNGPTAQRRLSWAQANPGKTYYDWLAYKFASGLPTDPVSGMKMLKSGELRTNEGRPVDGTAGQPLPGNTAAATSGLTNQDFTKAVNNAFGQNGVAPNVGGYGSLVPDQDIDQLLRRQQNFGLGA